MRYIDIDKMKPISLVRVEGSSKRLRQPRILTVEEFRLLMDQLQEPIRTMCIVAACLGLRASELVGLQWGDFDWKALEVHIQRGVVIGRVDEVKTTNSNRRLPVHPNLARHASGPLSNPGEGRREGRWPWLDFGVDAFNVFNRVNFKNFVGVQTSPFFGRANSANAAHQLQFSMKFHF